MLSVYAGGNLHVPLAATACYCVNSSWMLYSGVVCTFSEGFYSFGASMCNLGFSCSASLAMSVIAVVCSGDVWVHCGNLRKWVSAGDWAAGLCETASAVWSGRLTGAAARWRQCRCRPLNDPGVNTSGTGCWAASAHGWPSSQ